MALMQSKALRQYLAGYAENEVQLIPAIPEQFDHCLVIPAFDETWQDLSEVWARVNGNYLVILVINAPSVHQATLKLFARAAGDDGSGQIRYIPGEQPLLVIDRCTGTHTILPRHGVGLARKIGTDVALALISQGTVASRRINMTDADAILPADYFKSPFDPGDAAEVYPFEHIAEPGNEVPTCLYDLSTLYFAAGLNWAGSAYGYPSLGSTMAVNANHYAMVRGFPKKSAAEDFYLLNKLAKTGKVRRVAIPPIRLSGRLSTRVPFGTGPGIQKIMDLTSPLDQYQFYHPHGFALLKEFLDALNSYWRSPEGLLACDPTTVAFAEENNLGELLDRQRRQIKSEPVFLRFVRAWFDGFRTLKFIHFHRAAGLDSVPVKSVLEAPFLRHVTWQRDDLRGLRTALVDELFA